jgi:small ligand-binding sensory domain FIST
MEGGMAGKADAMAMEVAELMAVAAAMNPSSLAGAQEVVAVVSAVAEAEAEAAVMIVVTVTVVLAVPEVPAVAAVQQALQVVRA